MIKYHSIFLLVKYSFCNFANPSKASNVPKMLDISDQTGQYGWITEEGRLRMIGASNDTLTALNMSTNA